MQGYCVKCKSKNEIKNAVNSKTKNNRNIIKGNCEKCETKI